MKNFTAQLITKCAKQDVRLAKENGQITICGTKIGNVDILFSFETNLFQAVNGRSGVKITDTMPAEKMVSFISGIYVVEN